MSTRSFSSSRRAVAVLALAAVLVAACIAGAAQARTTQRHYPQAVRTAFISSCTRTAKAAANGRLTKTQASTYCRSALSCIERHLTLKQFEQTVRNMQAGRRNPNARVFTSCERAAVQKVVG